MTVEASFQNSVQIAGTTKTGSRTVTAGQRIQISETIPASSTDKLVALVLDVSQIKGYWIKAVGGDLVLETNAIDAAGGNTINLTDGESVFWDGQEDTAKLLTLDVTALYVTEAAAVEVELQAEFLVDPTV